MTDILNDGERYDPLLYGYEEMFHTNRYKFALQGISKEDSVLDIACGTGYGTKLISEVAKTVVGVDISPLAINYANTHYKTDNNSFMVSDLFSTNVTADIVISFETIEHVECTDFNQILDQLLRLTKKLLIGSFPYNETTYGVGHHKWIHLTEASISYLKNYGNLSIWYQHSDAGISKIRREISNIIFLFEKA